MCAGKVTAMTVSPDGRYCVAAIAEKLHIWQVSVHIVVLMYHIRVHWLYEHLANSKSHSLTGQVIDNEVRSPTTIRYEMLF